MRSLLAYALAAAGIAWPLIVVIWARRLRPVPDVAAERRTTAKAVFMLFGSSILLAAAWLLFR
jgi:hypothetical protein